MAKRRELSDRQKKILEYINTCIANWSRPPTIREIREAADISSTSVVNYNLVKLEEKGYLSRDAAVSRGLRLTDKALELLGEAPAKVMKNLVRIPMAGSIAAGEPIEFLNESFEPFDEDDAIELSVTMLPEHRTDDLFALRVSGNSMIDAMVNDGDIVIMRHQTEARNGDMVAVWLTDEDTTTLKHFYNEGERVRLQPANPLLLPIYVHPSKVRVQGKVMMVLRQTA